MDGAEMISYVYPGALEAGWLLGRLAGWLDCSSLALANDFCDVSEPILTASRDQG